jgi:hypothetical protein
MSAIYMHIRENEISEVTGCVQIKYHAMKAHWQSGGVASPFLTSAPDGGEVPPSRPGRLTAEGKSPQHPLDGVLGGPHSWTGRCREDEYFLSLPGIETWAVSPLLLAACLCAD